MQGLLARYPMAHDDKDRTPVYAVDVTPWPRCDAEASPERGYYYHPSRHSAGQPIVAFFGLTAFEARKPPRLLERMDRLCGASRATRMIVPQ